MPTDTKIVKSFYTDITMSEDFFVQHIDLCIISRDGKFGVAEKTENGRLIVLVECIYDYIDTFCSEKGFTNLVSVSLNGKFGLYAFRYTAGSDNDINCEMVASCEYNSIHTLTGNHIAILEKENGFVRYYNVLAEKLSLFYTSVSCDETGCLYCFSDDESQKWIDILTDNVIYDCSETDFTCAEKVYRGFYVFSCYYCCDSSFEYNKTDLVFYDDNLMTAYVTDNVTDLHITKYDYDRYGRNYVVSFLKNDKSYIISTKDFKWDFDLIKKIANEVNYT